MQKPFEFALILPCYNFYIHLPKTLQKIEAWKEKNFLLCLVNDGSSDASAEQIEKCLKENFSGHSIFVHRSENQGKGAAIRAGVAAVENKVNFVIFSDCDLYYGLKVVSERFLPLLRQGTDLVILDRSWNKQFHAESSLRRFGSKVFNHGKTLLTGVTFKDSQAGLKGISLANPIFPYCKIDGFSFDVELLSIAQLYRLKIEAIPIVDPARPQADTKSTVRLWSAFQMLLELFSIAWRRYRGDYRIPVLEDKIRAQLYEVGE